MAPSAALHRLDRRALANVSRNAPRPSARGPGARRAAFGKWSVARREPRAPSARLERPGQQSSYGLYTSAGMRPEAHPRGDDEEALTPTTLPGPGQPRNLHDAGQREHRSLRAAEPSAVAASRASRHACSRDSTPLATTSTPRTSAMLISDSAKAGFSRAFYGTEQLTRQFDLVDWQALQVGQRRGHAKVVERDADAGFAQLVERGNDQLHRLRCRRQLDRRQLSSRARPFKMRNMRAAAPLAQLIGHHVDTDEARRSFDRGHVAAARAASSRTNSPIRIRPACSASGRNSLGRSSRGWRHGISASAPAT